jgi:hypothetical protein
VLTSAWIKVYVFRSLVDVALKHCVVGDIRAGKFAKRREPTVRNAPAVCAKVQKGDKRIERKKSTREKFTTTPVEGNSLALIRGSKLTAGKAQNSL